MTILKFKGRYYRFYPTDKPLGYAEEDLEIDALETAFLLVDVYGTAPIEKFSDHFAKDDYLKMAGISFKELELKDKIITNYIKPSLDAAREIGMYIVYVNNSCPNIALSRSEFGRMLKKAQNVDVEEIFSEDCVDPKEYAYGASQILKIYKDIAPKFGDFYIRKHVYSGFFDTRLDTLLRNLSVKNLICAGFRLDVCLLATMLDALYRNYRVILLRDCTLACELPNEMVGLSFTNRMITYVECFIGYTVTSKEFINACERSQYTS
jgi:ureidoacrylate peracid hydrolase